MRRHGGGGNGAAKDKSRGDKGSAGPGKARIRRTASAANHRQELERRDRELEEAHEYQAATSEVLAIIARSPKDAKPVFDAIVESAGRLCGAVFSAVQLYDGEHLRHVATNNFTQAASKATLHSTKIDRSNLGARAIIDRTIVHVADVLEDPDYSRELALAGGWRAVASVPLMRDGTPIGVISIAKAEPLAFTDSQIRLLQTFADQAVIAIENARLFDEVEERTGELSEALQQQTATADVLKVISRSTFDLEPVLQALVDTAIELCSAARGHVFAVDGDFLRLAAVSGLKRDHAKYLEEHPLRIGHGSAAGRAAQERRIVQIDDALADPEYELVEASSAFTFRTVLGVPMLRNDALEQTSI